MVSQFSIAPLPGGGASIAGGIGILLAMGAAYGGKKVWDSRKFSN